MKTTGNTILITGGGSGIGFATARLFSDLGNQVIIAGRNKERLEKAAGELKNTTAIPCDITRERSVDELVKRVTSEFSDMNILMNNAGKAYAYSLYGAEPAFEIAKDEMTTNFLSAVRLTDKLLPLLAQKKEAAVINTGSVAAFVPGMSVPTYSASKSALHSYSRVLRATLAERTGIKVFEIMPPLVETEFSKALKGEKIPATKVAEDIRHALQNDIFEFHVAGAEQLYQLFLASPGKAFNVLNGRS